jgi:hypothetical protein
MKYILYWNPSTLETEKIPCFELGDRVIRRETGDTGTIIRLPIFYSPISEYANWIRVKFDNGIIMDQYDFRFDYIGSIHKDKERYPLWMHEI